MYQVTNIDDKKFGSYDDMESARLDAQKRANRYQKRYFVIWHDHNGTHLLSVSPVRNYKEPRP